MRVTTLTDKEMDGRFGYVLFDGKQVAINYDQHYLLVYTRLPRQAMRGYTKPTPICCKSLTTVSR